MQLYSVKRAEEVIDEFIPKNEYKEVLKQRMCRKIPYEEIAESVGYSTQWCKEIVKKYRAALMALL